MTSEMAIESPESPGGRDQGQQHVDQHSSTGGYPQPLDIILTTELGTREVTHTPGHSSLKISSAELKPGAGEGVPITTTGASHGRFTASSHSLAEESSSVVTTISAHHDTPTLADVNNNNNINNKVTSAALRVTEHEYVPTDQHTSMETSAAPMSSTTVLPTTQSAQQYTREITDEATTLRVTTAMDTSSWTSTTRSSEGTSQRRRTVTTAEHDVTTVVKTTSKSVTSYGRSTTFVKNATAHFTTASHQRHFTSAEASVSTGYNYSVGSTAAYQLPTTYIIAGAAGLAVLFLVLMCIVIVCICKKRRRKNSGIDEFDYSFDLRARSRRLATGPSRVSYSFTHNSFSDIPGTLAGLGGSTSSNLAVPASNMKKAHSNSDNLLTRYNLEPNMYISDEPDELGEDGKTSPVVANGRRNNSDPKFDRNDSMYSTFKRANKGVELAGGFHEEILV